VRPRRSSGVSNRGGKVPGRAPNVFSIPHGLPFLKTLAGSLLTGALTSDFRYDPADPLALAGVTIFLPTRRAARVLRSEFVDLLGGRSAILPMIRALGETDDDSGFFEAELPAVLDLGPPLSGTGRLVELGRLILAWRNRLPQVVLDIHAESPLIAPASPADAIWLARNLAELIDAIETEELDWEALDGLDAGEHALWWQLTLAFLKIARTYWPERLAELKHSSPARHRNAVLRAEAERIAAGRVTGPIIIAGSTGSIPATAGLITAVKALPNGTIVLPGLDRKMSDEEWELVGGGGSVTPDPASRTHPQYGLHQLLKSMSVERSEVSVLGRVESILDDRSAVLSRALLPAKATDSWTRTREELASDKLLAAFADVALIEAANEREEATAIAIALRLALEEDENSQAALVTPDRGLARRVGAELQRFGIEADDSAGIALSATQPGTLARLLVEAALRPYDAVRLVALLKHPLARFGRTAEVARRAADVLELMALRGGTDVADISTLEALLDKALARHGTDRHPPPWRDAVDANDIAEARGLTRRIAAAVQPLTGTFVAGDGRKRSMVLTLADWAERTGRALEAVAMDERGSLGALWGSEAGETLAALFGSIIEAEGQMEADGPQWCDIMEALSAGEAVKPRSMRHPRVFIFGALESRLQSVDLVVLGGMNEGTWPAQTSNDPFLSRTMKAGIGLEPPERRTGQLAHDFQMACGTRRLIFSRSMRQGSAPTVASRWLQRLQALGGETLAERLRANGAAYLHWMRMLDEGGRQPLAERPQPKPPAELQPRKYSFSEVTRLRRDPYSIYARRILRLEPVDPFNRDPGAAERGSLYHRIVERFIKGGFDSASHEGQEAMVRLINEAFDEEKLPAHIDTIWRPRFRTVAKAFLSWERERRPGILKSFTEVSAAMDLGLADVRLTGIADRLDRLKDGSIDIIDYKTGSAPSPKEARALLDPQLALEAAALKAGAFGAIGPARPHSLSYVRLKPGRRFAVDKVNNENGKSRETKSAEQLAAESLSELKKLLGALLTGRYGFASRLIVQKERDYGGEYDHLARVAEWATADSEDDDEE